MAIEPKYEFDALQYVDFAAPDFVLGNDGPDEDTLNAWFEQRRSNHGSPAKKAKLMPSSQPSPVVETKTAAPPQTTAQAHVPVASISKEKVNTATPAAATEASTAPAEATVERDQSEQCEGKVAEEKPRRRFANLMRNWSGKSDATESTSSEPQAQKDQRPKRSGSTRTRSNMKSSVPSSSRPKSANRSKSAGRSSASTETERPVSAGTRSRTTSTSKRTSKQANPAPSTAPATTSTSTAAPTFVRKPDPNLRRSVRASKGPKSPTMMSRQRAGSTRRKSTLTSEELEMQQIKAARAEARKMKRRSRRSFDMVMHGNPMKAEATTAAAHTVKPVTVPEPFAFRTDARFGKPVREQENGPQRLQTSASTYQPKPTKVKPFNFSHLQQPVERPTTAEHVPLMAAVNHFQSATPERYHKPAAKDNVFKPSAHAPIARTGPTQARSPAITKPRLDKATLPTSEDLQLAEMQQRQPFKARPVKPEVMESDSGTYGVPKIAPRACTVAQSPHITKANPHATREQLAEAEARELAAARRFKAQPMPDLDSYSFPHGSNKAPTKPKPFALQTDKLGEQRRQQFEAQVKQQEQQQEQLRVFKAQEPTALAKPAFVPSKSTRPLTSVGNVVLASDARAKQRAEFDAKQKAAQQLEELRQARRAREAAEQEAKEIAQLRETLVHKASKIRQFNNVAVQGSDKPLTEPMSPQFVLEQRLAARNSRV
eukprot:TRINITY_DN6298_c0_g1_i1.p1 TRINITY_DN6298_c0_g1~~TRINITY_DN6298_c0_g1_i1.p1  ORF type:complete len:714 (+),score=228.36 TRINITY_DN6298_c0_g1_i1:72-2213(+)